MSTSATEVSLNDPILTTIPQRISFIPPAPTTPYELRLVHHKLDKAATRMAVNRTIMKVCDSSENKGGLTDTWPVPMYTTMLRSERHHAGELARQQEAHYSEFSLLSKSKFTRFDIRIGIEFLSDVDFNRAQEIIRKAREALVEMLPPSLEKIGICESFHLAEEHPALFDIRIKTIVAAYVDEPMFQRFVAALPPGVSIVDRRTFYREEFAAELKRLVAPDLPCVGERRADFERLLKSLQQIIMHRCPEEFRSRFALSSNSYANLQSSAEPDTAPEPVPIGKIRLSTIPRSPKTGLPARFISIPISIDTKPEDLDDSEWLEIIPPD